VPDISPGNAEPSCVPFGPFPLEAGARLGELKLSFPAHEPRSGRSSNFRHHITHHPRRVWGLTTQTSCTAPTTTKCLQIAHF